MKFVIINLIKEILILSIINNNKQRNKMYFIKLNIFLLLNTTKSFFIGFIEFILILDFNHYKI